MRPPDGIPRLFPHSGQRHAGLPTVRKQRGGPCDQGSGQAGQATSRRVKNERTGRIHMTGYGAPRMVDIMDSATRSRVMSRIRSTNTKPELVVRRLLHGMGFRYRLYARSLPGTPDLVFSKYRAVVFIHGCFWHGHDCPAFRFPGTRKSFWSAKINRNRERDRISEQALADTGWRVAAVWECALRGSNRIGGEVSAKRLAAWLRGSRKRFEIRGGGGK